MKVRLVLLAWVISWGLIGCEERKVNEAQSGSETTSPSTASIVRTDTLEARISEGEQTLLDPEPNIQKQTANAAYEYGDYQKAESQWEASLQLQRNDPETLIYLNNARIGNDPAYSIAVPVPIDAEINVAKEILRGAAQAQQEINTNGGVKGKPIKIAIANDGNNPNLAQQLAHAFNQNSEILGVIGHFSSDVTLEAAQVYQSEGLVAISPTSSSTAISNVGSYVFRTVSSDCFAGNALVEYSVNQLRVNQAAIIYNSTSSYSTSLRDVFKSSLEKQGGTVVAEFNFSQPNFDIVSVLTELKQKGAKAIVLFPNSSGINALETLDKTYLIALINRGELPLLGGDSLYKPRTLQLGQENVVNMVVSVPWHTKNTNTQFATTAKQLWGGDVNWRTVLTYDATMALAKAIETNPTREGIQQTLLSPEFEAQGASAPIKFLPTGDRAAEVELVKIVAGNSSGFGYDFVPINNSLQPTVGVCRSN